jgi:hypothetical protein
MDELVGVEQRQADFGQSTCPGIDVGGGKVRDEIFGFV